MFGDNDGSSVGLLRTKHCLTSLTGVITYRCSMSARKIQSLSPDKAGTVTVQARQTRLDLTPDSVVIHKGGIEFQCDTAFPKWVEMTVTVQSPLDGGRVNCSGVVVECSGSKHSGYLVSMVFTGLTKQAESKLSQLAFAQLR